MGLHKGHFLMTPMCKEQGCAEAGAVAGSGFKSASAAPC